jgi:hypothetical protein
MSRQERAGLADASARCYVGPEETSTVATVPLNAVADGSQAQESPKAGTLPRYSAIASHALRTQPQAR